MPQLHNHSIGRRGEDTAALLLQNKGLQIVARNFEYFSKGRGRKGEIDIIAVDNPHKIVHFVEVKYRQSSTYGSAIEQITTAKINSLRNAIAYYCLKNQHYASYYKQVDIITIDGNQEPQLLPNAIQFD